jgi:hypothetical protein
MCAKSWCVESWIIESRNGEWLAIPGRGEGVGRHLALPRIRGFKGTPRLRNERVPEVTVERSGQWAQIPKGHYLGRQKYMPRELKGQQVGG